MKNKGTKLKAMLVISFFIAIAMIGTMPMIMGDTTDGGGGSNITAWEETETGSMVGSIYTSGSCYFKVAPNNDGYGVYKWRYDFYRSTNFKVKDIQSIDFKMYGYEFYVDYRIQLSYDYLGTGSWSSVWYRSYLYKHTIIGGRIPIHWETKSWDNDYTDISPTQYPATYGNHWRIDITIKVYVDSGYVCRTTSSSLSGYYNSVVSLINA